MKAVQVLLFIALILSAFVAVTIACGDNECESVCKILYDAEGSCTDDGECVCDDDDY